MMEIKTGARVRLTEGTRLGVDSGEKIEGTYTKFDWTIVDADASDVEFVVEWVGMSHATMNGGGRDYGLRCCGLKCQVRTTLARGDRQTFTVAS